MLDPQSRPGAVDAQQVAEAVRDAMCAGDRPARPGHGHGGDDRAPGHAQRPRHLPRRPDDDAGRHGLRLRLQCVQRADRGHRLRRQHRRQRQAGRPLTATATEAAKTRRTGVYDIEVRDQTGAAAAAFRGRSMTRKGKAIVPALPCTRGEPDPCPSRAPARRPGADRDRQPRRDRRALQLQRLRKVAAARLRQRAALPQAPSTPPGVHPSDCKQLADLAKFPFTTKADLRDNYPFGMFAVPREQVVRIHASSGTTGKPTVVGYTQGDIDTLGRPDGALDPRRRRPARRHRAQRLRLRPVHRRPGRALRRRAPGLHRGPDVGGQTEKQVQLIEDFRPTSSWSRPATCR
jgi:hypothetical protein